MSWLCRTCDLPYPPINDGDTCHVCGAPRSGAPDLVDVPHKPLSPAYEAYLQQQRELFMSHEADKPTWAAGLRRFVDIAFALVPRYATVLDCACGDGVALDELQNLGFPSIYGVEISPTKLMRCRAAGFQVVEADMHDLSHFDDEAFNAILSSHTLEHAYDPDKVVKEFHRLLVPKGDLFVVLPFPDSGSQNDVAHCGKVALGTTKDDGGERTALFFKDRGFRCVELRQDSAREPELWLFLRKLG